MKEIIENYIKDIEKQINELGVKVNSDGSLTSHSPYLIEVNGDEVKKLTAKLEGFKDALKLLGEEKQNGKD